MAVHDLTDQIRQEKVAERYPPLFKRLPDRLFTPLASANRFQYWSLLCALHAKRFGPEAPLPPSTHHALAGATVIANLSASDETIGKADYRRALVSQQSARLLCAYLYADAGHGESTTDMVFAAHDLICENGTLLSEAKPFGAGYACTELDLGRMVSERCRSTTFQPEGEGYQTVMFHLPLREVELTRYVSPVVLSRKKSLYSIGTLC